MPYFFNSPWYPTIYKHEISPSSGVDDILTAGQVSTTSDYATANFNDISEYTYIFIKFYYEYEGVTKQFYTGLSVSDIPVNSYLDFTVTAESPVNILSARITRTSVALRHYSGAYRNIYCDIKGIKLPIWD